MMFLSDLIKSCVQEGVRWKNRWINGEKIDFDPTAALYNNNIVAYRVTACGYIVQSIFPESIGSPLKSLSLFRHRAGRRRLSLFRGPGGRFFPLEQWSTSSPASLGHLRRRIDRQKTEEMARNARVRSSGGHVMCGTVATADWGRILCEIKN